MSLLNRLVDRAAKAAADNSKTRNSWLLLMLAAVIFLLSCTGTFVDAVAFLSNPPSLTVISGNAVTYEEKNTSSRHGGKRMLFIRLDTPSPQSSLFRRRPHEDGYDALREAAAAKRRMTFYIYHDDCLYACDIIKASVDDRILFDDGMKMKRDQAWILGPVVIAALTFLVFGFWVFIRMIRLIRF